MNRRNYLKNLALVAEQIANRLMEVYDDYEKACQKLEKSMDYVREVQFASMNQIQELVYGLT